MPRFSDDARRRIRASRLLRPVVKVRRAARRVRGRGLRLRDWQPEPCLRVPAHRVERARFAAVDAHNHLGRWLSRDGGWMAPDVGALLELMDCCNVATIVNLDGRWGQELQANLDRYDLAHPGRFVTFCHVDWRETARPGFSRRLLTGLERSAAMGAKGLKVWKDLGLTLRDDRGRLLLPDDQRLAPLWETAGHLGLPVLMHTADPVAFFKPADRSNERLEELLANPGLRLSDPRYPSFDRLIDALEAVVGSHPDTTFIGAHVGGYAEDLAWVNRMLDTYPNFNVDLAGRVAELGRQPRAARRLLLRHSDRILFGTDAFPPSQAAYAVYFRFLETDDEHFGHSADGAFLHGRWAISGLDLPEDVLRRVYRDNAGHLLPDSVG